MFLEKGEMQVGRWFNMDIYEKVTTKTTFGHLHKRIASLKELKRQLIEKLWNKTGPDGNQLKYAISDEFARKESTTWRTGATKGGRSKKYVIMKLSESTSSPYTSVVERMHGPTSFLLRVPEGSWAHNKFLATKNTLIANMKQMLTLVPDESFYSQFIDDLNSYVE